MDITFLRHALTNLNGKGFIATQLDYSINEEGKRQCKDNVFKEEEFDNIYCSPFKRTIETAQLVYPYKKPIIMPELAQRDLGELNEKYKKDYDLEYLRLVREYLVNPKNAETIGEIIYRLNKFFNYLNINQQNDDKILVVTHNGIMRIIKKYYLFEKQEIESKNLGKFTLTLKR